MKKIFMGLVAMGVLLSSPAYAGGVIVASLGSTSHNISKENYAKAQATAISPAPSVADVETETGDSYYSFGYAWDNGMDLSYSNLGSAKYTDNDSSLENYSQTLPDVTTISTIDLSYVHTIPVSNAANLRLRGGYALISLGGDVKKDKHYAESGILYGVGVEFGKYSVEYKSYSIAFGEENAGEKNEFYSGASVISVGYQF